METPKEYYYTYYSYEEYGRGYIGSRKCKCLPEKDKGYFGSFKDKSFNPKYKIIIKEDYASREEAYADEIILQRYYKIVENPHFANRSYQTSTKFYVPTEQAIQNGRKGGFMHKENKTGVFSLTLKEKNEACKKGGKKAVELGIGVHGLTLEQRIENGKKGGPIGGKKSYELKLGIHSYTLEEQLKIASIGGKVGGRKSYEMKVGVHCLTKEQRTKNGKKGGTKAGLKNKQNKTGICGLTKDQRSETAKKVNSQKWKCTETDYVTNAGALTMYQRKRGIDTSKRIRIS